MNSRAKQKGFTIVELLIVIVVIGILAAITIVAYNGIQTRAENTKTINAVSQWAKALQLYKAEKGNYPTVHSCLGDTSTYADSHNGRCWGLSGDGTWFVNSTFLSQMSEFIGNYPSPSSKDINAATGGSQYRGAMYYRQAMGNELIYVEIVGATSASDCPKIGGLSTYSGGTTRPNGVSCYYSLPQ